MERRPRLFEKGLNESSTTTVVLNGLVQTLFVLVELAMCSRVGFVGDVIVRLIPYEMNP